MDTALTALEEAALAHVLCSPETSYGDVAGQMFVVQAVAHQHELFAGSSSSSQTQGGVVSEKTAPAAGSLYAMFQKLSTQGATVIKHPRTGNASKKVFRFSFVEGSVYLTWKGKYGNQGVDLADISAVVDGFSQDLKVKYISNGISSFDESLFLSIVSGGKSIDLSFPTVEERSTAHMLLELLRSKEKGDLARLWMFVQGRDLLGQKDEVSGNEGEDGGVANWLLWYSSLGPRVLSDTVRTSLLARV
jgi:hypothetical protein